jgi:hypothetical protein
MNWLAEDAIWIWAAGAVALTLALVLYFQTGTRNSQFGVLAVILITTTLLVTEFLIETPREAVAQTLDEIAAAVRANDMPAVLGYISPTAATLRQEVETAMPQVTIDMATIRGKQIDVYESAVPPIASVQCTVFVVGTVKRNRLRGARQVAVHLTMTHENGRWLVKDYTADQDWRNVIGRQ